MTKWMHAMCRKCWTRENGDLVAVTFPEATRARCCFCGEFNRDGIFVRRDPDACPCAGQHGDEDAVEGTKIDPQKVVMGQYADRVYGDEPAICSECRHEAHAPGKCEGYDDGLVCPCGAALSKDEIEIKIPVKGTVS